MKYFYVQCIESVIFNIVYVDPSEAYDSDDVSYVGPFKNYQDAKITAMDEVQKTINDLRERKTYFRHLKKMDFINSQMK